MPKFTLLIFWLILKLKYFYEKIFEVELFDFHGEDISEKKDKSIIKRSIKTGEGYATPKDGSRVVVSLKGTDAGGRVFDHREKLEFELGEGSNNNVLESLEYALTKFKKDETARLEIKANAAWGSKGNKLFNIPENTDVRLILKIFCLFEKKISKIRSCSIG